MADPLLVYLGIAITILAILGGIAVKFGQSVIPAYIIAGVVIGPYSPSIGGVSFALIPESAVLQTLADLGVILLLFFIGMEFDPRLLIVQPRKFAAVGTIDVLINFGLGMLIALVLGYSIVTSLFIGGIVYISSSAIITKGLLDFGWIADPESEPILAVLVFEDLVIAGYLAFLSAIALGSADLVVAATSVGLAFAFIVVLFVLAEIATEHVERLFQSQPDEVFTLGVFGIAILVGGIATQFGVSEAVTAFFVGALFGRTSQHERVVQLIGPLRDAFAATFFFTIGIGTNLGVVGPIGGLLVAAIVVSIGGKLLSGYVTGWLYGLGTRRSLRVGIGLVARGEFSIVVGALAAAVGTGVIATDVPTFAVVYVLAMSITGSVLMNQTERIEEFLGLSVPE